MRVRISRVMLSRSSGSSVSTSQITAISSVPSD
jgi:hypothetical protein